MKTQGQLNTGAAIPVLQPTKKQTAQVRWPHACHIQPLGVLFEKTPHRNYYPGEEAFFRSVTAALESLARFDPPGSDRGTPTPSVPVPMPGLQPGLRAGAVPVPDRSGAGAVPLHFSGAGPCCGPCCSAVKSA